MTAQHLDVLKPTMTRPTIVISVNAAWNLVNFRRSLLQGLVAGGYRVVAIAPPDGRENELAALGVEFEPIAMNGRGMSPAEDARLLLSYLRILRRVRPQAYLGFTIKPNVYGGLACRLLNIPRIANIAGLGTTFLHRGMLNRLVRRLYSTGLRGADCVFFQNPDDRQRFLSERIVDPGCARLLPGSGVDLTRFAPQERAADGRTVFLLVTRLLWAKGVAEFVAAAQELRRVHGTSVVCQILGIRDHSPGGVDAETLERWQAEGQVELLDSVTDVRPTLTTADCVVLPSYYPEGTPRSLLEAAAMGKPIVTTDMPGCRDVVEDGVNGYVCQPRDTASLVEAMTRYLALSAGERRIMGQKSRTKAERDFDEKIVIDAYLERLSHVIHTK